MRHLTETDSEPYRIYTCPSCLALYCGRSLQLQICTSCAADTLHSLDPTTARHNLKSTALYCILCLRIQNATCIGNICHPPSSKHLFVTIPDGATSCP